MLTVDRARELLKGERTALVKHTRGLLAEFGIVVAQGVGQLRRALPELLEAADNGLPMLARETFAELQERLIDFDVRIKHYDRRIAGLAQQMPGAQRAMQLPGVGPLTATAVVATVGDAGEFANGRQFCAWLGLIPRQYSSGGKTCLGRITKCGDRYLRTLLIHGARGLLLRSADHDDPRSHWATAVPARRGFNKATVALAAKQARILWAMLSRGQDYRTQTVTKVT